MVKRLKIFILFFAALAVIGLDVCFADTTIVSSVEYNAMGQVTKVTYDLFASASSIFFTTLACREHKEEEK